LYEAEPQFCLPKGRRPRGAATPRHVPGSKNFASCLKTFATFWSGHERHLGWCEAEPQSCLPKGRRPHGAAVLRHVRGSNDFASCLKTADSRSPANKNMVPTPTLRGSWNRRSHARGCQQWKRHGSTWPLDRQLTDTMVETSFPACICPLGRQWMARVRSGRQGWRRASDGPCRHATSHADVRVPLLFYDRAVSAACNPCQLMAYSLH
jgi:hypothetical protein